MRVPTATYRIQFRPDFKFSDAEAIVPYLAQLGISDLYASPIFKARQGSTHGYDIVDPQRLNPELADGTEEAAQAAFEQLNQSLKSHGLGWLQDIVPNHMAYDSDNAFLMDVLEYGPNSDYYQFFDIQWEHPYTDIQGKVLAPLLGDFYGRCLERGDLQLRYDASGLSIIYYDLRLPLRIESYTQIITHDLDRIQQTLGREHPDFIKLLGILYLLNSAIAETCGQQYRDQVAFVKGILWDLYQSNQDIQTFIDQNLAQFNGRSPQTMRETASDGFESPDPDASSPLESPNPDPDAKADFDLLHQMLSNQFFRLSYWKVGAEELNYRRFFTVNELICVSIEDPQVFAQTHRFIQSLVDQGAVTGVRIDHIDGLYNPQQYLDRLRQHLGNLYITVEKILEPGETLPESWPVQGTSGYEFLNQVNGIFCRSDHAAAFSQIYQTFTGQTQSYETLAVQCKRLIADKNLAGDIENLANQLKRIASRYRYASDFTLIGLRRAIVEVLVLFPIYRTYITGDGLNERNRTYILRVIQAAKRRVPNYTNELDFIGKLMLLEHEDWLTAAEQAEWVNFVMRMQQFSGPLMAKGIEDTLLYIYHRFLSLNEVGGSPDHFGVTLPEFHAFNQHQVAYWPYSMNATSTHDTKRSEDVRARLNVLSELPEEWKREVLDWQVMNQPHKQGTIPDANDEYFLYQTLVGVWPFEPFDLETLVQRLRDYVIKAVREAKVHTAWLRPDTDYEEGFLAFIDRLLDPRDDNLFFKRLREFQGKIAFYGMQNSLSQLLIKLTAPGVPDIYQGTEMWDLSLVDPDNRRPVDYHHRRHELQELQRWADRDRPALLDNLIHYPEDGRIKLFLMATALAARSQFLNVFQDGDYLPIKVVGDHADQIIAFVRRDGTQQAMTVVPRFLTQIVPPGTFPLGEAVWGNTILEMPEPYPAQWQDVFSQQSISGGATLPVGQLLNQFPVALWVTA
ncbi:malto-oligosyltrehalose synthase [Lyngbya confervoides]|uniref:Malto-oligosyltrehalose synthase n=1 Tax=Lyngbya confervoides BDU141951 TaxID=1574623 RepID=A0ABD4T1R4_9CYAN|nr:malto-oligosyltrehalose synthase [Lyngbya confervoides]MCM1982593.1 malto-oligosyltrehalose synthase [Lyngbya confervoides BDU141951]